MIPPWIAAAFAKSSVRWGSIGAAVFVLVAYTNWKTYDHMRTACEDEKIVALKEQLNSITKDVIAAKTIDSDIIRQHEIKSQALESEVQTLRQKVAKHDATHKAIPLSHGTRELVDDFTRLSNRAGQSVPTSDVRPGGSEVQPLQVPAQTVELVRVDGAEGESVELTTDELKQLAVDVFETLAMVKQDYQAFSEWNARREALETARALSQ